DRRGYPSVVTSDERTPPPADPREPQIDIPAQRDDYPGHTEHLEPRPDHGEESYVGSGRMTGRRALVTGGDSGIGRAVAIAFAREGADVAITYLPEERADADATVELVRAADRRGLAHEVDLRDEAACRRIVDDTAREFGGLDIVVNNAGYQMAIESFEQLTTEQMVRTFSTNVFALLWVSQAALPHLQPGSAIVNSTSIQAYDPSPSLLDYAATKAAIVNLTANLARSLAERGIRVNAVAPGPVWTPLQPPTQPPEKVESFGNSTPLGRPGQPADLAPAYVFLASQDSRYVTGETIAVTGGRLTP
ncbi:MAG TPA: glucose 1-dehydrogenase, partial [Ilumatobacteraceae bacterium]|nr:glucose 1-dehydrogenase [Ilumatobacteraceae bacterium]